MSVKIKAAKRKKGKSEGEGAHRRTSFESSCSLLFKSDSRSFNSASFFLISSSSEMIFMCLYSSIVMLILQSPTAARAEPLIKQKGFLKKKRKLREIPSPLIICKGWWGFAEILQSPLCDCLCKFVQHFSKGHPVIRFFAPTSDQQKTTSNPQHNTTQHNNPTHQFQGFSHKIIED